MRTATGGRYALGRRLLAASFSCQLRAHRRQLLAARGGRFGKLQIEREKRVEQDLGDDEAGVSLVVGGDHEPRCTARAGSRQAFSVDLHVVSPESPLFDVRRMRRRGPCRRFLGIRPAIEYYRQPASRSVTRWNKPQLRLCSRYTESCLPA